MHKSIYKEHLTELLFASDQFKSRIISLQTYQSQVFKVESSIVSIEEKALRSLLQNHENELELIRFTTGDPIAIDSEVDRFREKLHGWL